MKILNTTPFSEQILYYPLIIQGKYCCIMSYKQPDRALRVSGNMWNVFPSRSCLLFGMLYYSIFLYYKDLVNTCYSLLFFAYPNYSQKLMS